MNEEVRVLVCHCMCRMMVVVNDDTSMHLHEVERVGMGQHGCVLISGGSWIHAFVHSPGYTDEVMNKQRHRQDDGC